MMNRMSELKHYGVLGMKWGVRKDKHKEHIRKAYAFSKATNEYLRSKGSSAMLSVRNIGKDVQYDIKGKGVSDIYKKTKNVDPESFIRGQLLLIGDVDVMNMNKVISRLEKESKRIIKNEDKELKRAIKDSANEEYIMELIKEYTN